MTDERIIAYFLSELSLDERDRLIESIAGEPDFACLVDMIEDELLDAYIADELSPEQRLRLEEFYLTRDGSQEKLTFAAALKRHSDQKSKQSRTTLALPTGHD